MSRANTLTIDNIIQHLVLNPMCSETAPTAKQLKQYWLCVSQIISDRLRRRVGVNLVGLGTFSLLDPKAQANTRSSYRRVGRALEPFFMIDSGFESTYMSRHDFTSECSTSAASWRFSVSVPWEKLSMRALAERAKISHKAAQAWMKDIVRFIGESLHRGMSVDLEMVGLGRLFLKKNKCTMTFNQAFQPSRSEKPVSEDKSPRLHRSVSAPVLAHSHAANTTHPPHRVQEPEGYSESHRSSQPARRRFPSPHFNDEEHIVRNHRSTPRSSSEVPHLSRSSHTQRAAALAEEDSARAFERKSAATRHSSADGRSRSVTNEPFKLGGRCGTTFDQLIKEREVKRTPRSFSKEFRPPRRSASCTFDSRHGGHQESPPNHDLDQPDWERSRSGRERGRSPRAAAERHTHHFEDDEDSQHFSRNDHPHERSSSSGGAHRGGVDHHSRERFRGHSSGLSHAPDRGAEDSWGHDGPSREGASATNGAPRTSAHGGRGYHGEETYTSNLNGGRSENYGHNEVSTSSTFRGTRGGHRDGVLDQPVLDAVLEYTPMVFQRDESISKRRKAEVARRYLEENVKLSEFRRRENELARRKEQEQLLRNLKSISERESSRREFELDKKKMQGEAIKKAWDEQIFFKTQQTGAANSFHQSYRSDNHHY